MIDWWNRVTGAQDDEEDPVAKTLRLLGQGASDVSSGMGQGVSDAASTVSQGISDAGSAISSGLSSATQAVSDAYAVPTEQRPPQYSGPSYAQPSLAPGEPSTLEKLPGWLDTATGPEGILEPAGGVIRTTGRISDLQNQAAGELGRSPIDPRVLDDPGWRARHPDEAAEADTLKQQNTLGLMGQVGEVPRAAQRAAGALEAAAPAAAAVPEPPAQLSNAERVAAADARMAEQGSTVVPGVFGALPGPDPRRGVPTVEAISEQLSAARDARSRAVLTGDAVTERAANDHMRELEEQLADAVNARRTLEPRITSDIGRRVESLPLSAETADTLSGAGARPGAVRPEDLSGPVGLPVDMAGRANASAGALPDAAGRSDPLAGVNRVLSQGLVSSASGGMSAAAADQLGDPNDPNRQAKAFVAGALGPPLAVRGARGVAKLAGAAPPSGAPGAAAAFGVLPNAVGRMFPQAAAAYARATARNAAEMTAKGIAPASKTDLVRGTVSTAGYSSMLGPAASAMNFAQGLWQPVWAAPKEPLRAVSRAIEHRNVAALREPGEALKGALTGLGQVADAAWDVLKGQGKYAPSVDAPNLSQRVSDPLGKRLLQALETPSRAWSGLPDALFGTVAQHTVERRRAAQLATEAGLTGQAWQQHVDRTMQDITTARGTPGAAPAAGAADALAAGEHASDEAALRRQLGAIGKRVKDVATMGNAPVLGNFVAPFFNSQWNSALKFFERTPAGLGMNTQATRFDKHYDAVLGSALTLGLTNYALRNGGVTGSGPSDPEQRRMLARTGWKPYSVYVNGVYLPNRAFGFGEQLLNATGEAADAIRYKKPDADTKALTMDALARIGNIAKQQPGANAYATISELVQFGPAAALADVAIRLTPGSSTSRQIATSMDPKERQPESGAGVGILEEAQQRYAVGTGYGRQGVPAKTDVSGQEVENPQQGWRAFVPRTSTYQGDPIITELLSKNVDLSRPRDAFTVTAAGADAPDGGIGTRTIRLTPEEKERWQQYRWQQIEQAFPMTETDEFKTAPPSIKTRIWRATVQNAGRYADGMVKSDIGEQWDARVQGAPVKQAA